jgi:DUF917 family protein
VFKNTGELLQLQRARSPAKLTDKSRYGLKVTVMTIAPHPVWTTPRGLEIGGPSAFDLPYEYKSPLKYVKPRSVIEEFRQAP